MDVQWKVDYCMMMYENKSDNNVMIPSSFWKIALRSGGEKGTTDWKNIVDVFAQRIHQPDLMSLNHIYVHMAQTVYIYIYIIKHMYIYICVWINIYIYIKYLEVK